MWKRLATLGLFILVGVATGQNPPARPPKAGIAKSDGGGKGQRQPNRQPSNKITSATVLSSPQASPTTCDEACQNAKKNLQIQNRLVSLTRWLVGVGLLQALSMILQAILLWKTRGDVRRQADSMENQLDEMHTGIEVAKVNAEAAGVTAKATELAAGAALAQIQVMKDRERSRLVIRALDEPNLVPSLDNQRAIIIRMHVANEGPTKAFNIRAYAMLNLVSEKTGSSYAIGFQQGFNSTLGSTENLTLLPWINVTGLGVEEESYLHTDEAIANRLREGTLFIQVSGILVFTDEGVNHFV